MRQAGGVSRRGGGVLQFLEVEGASAAAAVLEEEDVGRGCGGFSERLVNKNKYSEYYPGFQNGDEKMQGLYVMKLVRSFCASSSERKGDDPFEHVASILVNISQKEAGRKLLLEPKRGLLKQIIRQFDSPSPLRKKGVSGTIRNCCFEAENQLQNLLLVSEFLWPALLLPVAGNKIYNEQDTSKMPPELGSALSIEREAADDPEICVQALDAIYLLVLQEAGRRAFWSINGPRILQVGYENEENPQVMEAFERVGSLLIQENGMETDTTLAT
ncbi:hypothetical protein SASPL_142709 [Salvia splendens]|uniref:Protein HGH1 homolog n=1 Tax=Salvia splendens TaxID=180675 RepID=A0A8X8Z9Q3_SALSN|nr:hypothetical protein SASPL_142709 [Salvia splendens]